jgi:4-amino-4-deoxy-L-arabinose transferase-like glycosyltransferase
LLLTIAAYCVTRAVQSGSWRWLAVVGAVMGTAFLTKMLQAAVVLPGFAAAYVLAAPTAWRKRLLHLAIATLVLVTAASWWVLIVQAIPANSRPYIGGSTDNSVLDLAFGYNGMNRILGTSSEGASDWGGPAARMPNAAVGVHRLFTGEFGSEISWLLPVAVFVVAFGAFLALRRKLVRDEAAALVTWGGWLVITGLVFSFMNGTVHPYYTVALAPAIGALVGLGGVWAWRLLPGWDGRVAIVVMLVLGAGWSSILLTRIHFGPAWLPWAVAGSALVAAALTVPGGRGLARIGAVVGTVAALAGTTGYSIATAVTPHHGTVPNAVGAVHHTTEQTAKLLAGAGWTGDEATNRELADLLAAADTPWSAATNGSQSAAVLELASGTSVMAIGGWSGDPVPTLAQFIDDVHAHEVAYYVEAGAGARQGRVIRAQSRTESHTREIADWVAANYHPETVGDSLVYRLS